jgi:hypothetical protein
VRPTYRRKIGISGTYYETEVLRIKKKMTNYPTDAGFLAVNIP